MAAEQQSHAPVPAMISTPLAQQKWNSPVRSENRTSGQVAKQVNEGSEIPNIRGNARSKDNKFSPFKPCRDSDSPDSFDLKDETVEYESSVSRRSEGAQGADECGRFVQ